MKHKILPLAALILLFYALKLSVYAIKSDGGKFYISFLDVGQGDAILVSTPSGKKVLIDGGPNYEIDSYISDIFPPLFCNFEGIVLTHPHSDHLYGLNRVIKRCTAGTIYFDSKVYNSSMFEMWLSETDNMHLGTLYSGDSFEVDGVKFYALWPKRENTESKDSGIEEDSIILLVDYKDFEAVLTGDAGSNVLAQIDIDSYSGLIQGGLDVLKVAHHGSINSLQTDFLKAASPKYAVFSVGKDNKYGHPSSEVVNYLRGLGSEILRTDESGTIKFVYDNSSVLLFKGN